jgi:hypothetical protein
VEIVDTAQHDIGIIEMTVKLGIGTWNWGCYDKAQGISSDHQGRARGKTETGLGTALLFGNSFSRTD